MDLQTLNRLMTEIYIILGWGLGSSQANVTPSRQLAERVYRASWVDTKADGSTYNVGATIRRIAPNLSVQQGIELVLECHRAVQTHGAGTIQNMGEVPQGLRKYVN